ncbi:MAG: hypothetical protein SAK29_18190 [Scytonema sp. PMC 1069.18]|nr:hypothetical protein [Scytonema sp. PMC 1069.18]
MQDEQEFLQFFNEINPKLERKSFSSYNVVQEILKWTNFQRKLTEKICDIILDESFPYIPKGKEEERIQDLVETYFIENWENKTAKEHLSKIRDSILKSTQKASLLKLYQQILTSKEVITENGLKSQALKSQGVAANNSLEQQELLESGLVINQEEKLIVANLIYEKVFNRDWVAQELNKPQKPSHHIETLHSENNSSREASNVARVFAYLVLVILTGGFLVFIFRLTVLSFFQPPTLPSQRASNPSQPQTQTPEVCLEIANEITHALGTPKERLKVIEQVKVFTNRQGKSLDEQCDRKLNLTRKYNKLLHQYSQTLINASEFDKAVDTLCEITDEYEGIQTVKSILSSWSSNNSSLPDNKKETIREKVNKLKPSCPGANP